MKHMGASYALAAWAKAIAYAGGYPASWAAARVEYEEMAKSDVPDLVTSIYRKPGDAFDIATSAMIATGRLRPVWSYTLGFPLYEIVGGAL